MPTLKQNMNLKDLQTFVQKFEEKHGWEKNDNILNCFLLTEEVGELCRAVRKAEGLGFDTKKPESEINNVSDEIVDVMNYLLAIANRYNINLEEAFINKNTKNLNRNWQ